jgi:SAM-dependent methyltransferase
VSDGGWHGPRLVCPACRGPLNPELACLGPGCGRAYAWLEPGLPALSLSGEPDPCGPLPADESLAGWLRTIEPADPRFAAVSRAAIFLLALQQRDREPFYADLCESLLGEAAGVTTALDIGCGAGNLAFEMSLRFSIPVTGLDLDAHLLRWARRAFSCFEFNFPVRLNAASFGVARMAPSAHGAPSLQPVAADLFHPPFEAGAFDLVSLVNVLDSVAEPARALERAVELLRPGGWLLFASPDSWNLPTTPRSRWVITGQAWDRLFDRAGLETVTRADDLEWRLKDSPRLHHLYRLHGRLLRKR